MPNYLTEMHCLWLNSITFGECSDITNILIYIGFSTILSACIPMYFPVIILASAKSMVTVFSQVFQ